MIDKSKCFRLSEDHLKSRWSEVGQVCEEVTFKKLPVLFANSPYGDVCALLYKDLIFSRITSNPLLFLSL